MIGMTPSVSWTKAGLWLCFFLGAKASVACDGDVLLACDMAGSSKQLETCLIGDRVRYAFGAADMPDLVLERHVRDVLYEPWPGVGRSIWHVTGFQVDDITYRFNREGDKFLVHASKPGWNGRQRSLPSFPRQGVMSTGSHHYQAFWVPTGRKTQPIEIPLYYNIAEQRVWTVLTGTGRN